MMYAIESKEAIFLMINLQITKLSVSSKTDGHCGLQRCYMSFGPLDHLKVVCKKNKVLTEMMGKL